MAQPSIISAAPGEQARVQREGRTWVAYRWCDCILGPHWHKLSETATSYEKLVAKLRAPAIGDTRACPDCGRPQHYTGTEMGWCHDATFAMLACGASPALLAELEK